MDDTVPQKRCSNCKQIKPATTEFFGINYGKLRCNCKQCDAERAHKQWILKHPPNIIPEGHKRCGKCKTIFPLTSEFFYIHKAHKDGWDNLCKICARKHVKEYAERNKAREYIDTVRMEKRCPSCKNLFPLTPEFFHRDKAAKDGFAPNCKTCVLIRTKSYYANNRERVRAYVNRPEIREKRRQKNREYSKRPDYRQRSIIKHRLYYKNNKERVLERGKIRRQERKKTLASFIPRHTEPARLPTEPQGDRVHYAYILKYPADYPDQAKAGTAFYVGKGVHNRVYQHEQDAKRSAKDYRHHVIRKIWKLGLQVDKEILAYFATHEEALQYEIALIFFMNGLTNRTSGGEGAVGMKHSEETRRRISEVQRGRKPTEAQRRALAMSQIKGKTVSDTTRRKMSEAQKGKTHSEETRKNLRKAARNRSSEWRRKQSESHKGMPAWNKGIPLSEEHREKLRRARQGTRLSEEHKHKIAEAGKGRTPTEETRRKLSEAAKGRTISLEQRHKISETLKRRAREATTLRDARASQQMQPLCQQMPLIAEDKYP